MILNLQLISHSTDEILEYLGAKEDVERLIHHLKVEAELPAGLSMISVGQDAPDQQYQDIPWMHLDETNNPLAIKYYNGVSWVETQPLRAVIGPYSDMFIQYGQVSIRHIQTTRDTWIDSMNLVQTGGGPGQFLFPIPYKAGTTVHVQITPVHSAVHRGDTLDLNVAANLDAWTEIREWIKSGRKAFEWAMGNANNNNQGFHIFTKTTDATLGLNFTFNWMAMGEKI